jgi:beta-glucanase (GH16 family)
MLRNFIFSLIISFSFILNIQSQTKNIQPIYDYLVWQDEFEKNGMPNFEKWHHQTQLPNGNSWYNGEIQHYTNRIENTFVEDGVLSIAAIKETYTDQGVTKQYTSARLNSKFSFTYGRVEVRAKLPSGIGTWPAIWTLGKNIIEPGAYWDLQGYGTQFWPACGEIDIMEHWGTNQNFVQSAIHSPSSYGGTINHGGQIIQTASSDFHVYTLEWFPDRMIFSVDGIEHYEYNPEVLNPDTWPFDQEQYILLNFAILPSIDPNFTTDFLEIDYVRVYQETPLNSTNQLEKPQLNFSPNPVKSFANLETVNESIGGYLSIYSVQGQLIESFSIVSKNKKIDFSSYASGIYIAHFVQNNTNQIIKIVKE